MSEQKTILIVDDEEDLRETLEYQLKSKGYNVVMAVNGEDGLEKLKSTTPDLIILDVNMPKMNGLDFYDRVTGDDDKPKYPIMFLTARANMEQILQSLHADDVMAKPFDLEELVERAELIIEKNS